MVINVLFFQKNVVNEKLNFAVSMLILKCQCRDFQMALKMCLINHHNNVAKKLKIIKGIHQNKI